MNLWSCLNLNHQSPAPHTHCVNTSQDQQTECKFKANLEDDPPYHDYLIVDNILSRNEMRTMSVLEEGMSVTTGDRLDDRLPRAPTCIPRGGVA